MGFQLVVPNPSPRELTANLFSDITPSAYTVDTSYGGNLLKFDDDLTPVQQLQVKWRATQTSDFEGLFTLARAAVVNNRNWRNNTLPQLISGADAIIANAGSSTQEKQLAQAVKSLSNQVSDLSQQNVALIQLALGYID